MADQKNSIEKRREIQAKLNLEREKIEKERRIQQEKIEKQKKIWEEVNTLFHLLFECLVFALL